jgi:hypothetical protein
MLRSATRAVLAVCVVVFPHRSWAEDSLIHIPTQEEGYKITTTDGTKVAPSGYEGRTDYSTTTAVGNTPATAGKKVVARFTLGNQIKICPGADGKSEGEGEFSVAVDSEDTQGGGTNRLHLEMKAIAKYSGQVGDDAWLASPAKGEIDYTYTLSGTMRASNGAIATPAGSNITQHFTIPITVSRSMDMPKIGAAEGGDFMKGYYGKAIAMGNALSYWGGVYWAVAQIRWRHDNTCVRLAFNPSSYSTRLVPGDKTTVEAEVKSNGGDSVKGHFMQAQADSSGGTVAPVDGWSDTGMPMKFTFTAPIKKVPSASFGVAATSRAGIASDRWFAGLGKDWSGRISLTITNSGDQGESELQSWSNSSVTRIMIDLKDGKGDAIGYTEVHEIARNRQRALRGGAITLINASSQSLNGTFQDFSPATVEVLSQGGTYSVRVNYDFKHEGTARAQTCGRTDCDESDRQLLIGATLPGIDGKADTPNHLSGSKRDVKTGTGYRGTGTQTTTLTWDLAKEGPSR